MSKRRQVIHKWQQRFKRGNYIGPGTKNHNQPQPQKRTPEQVRSQLAEELKRWKEAIRGA